jgi:hypothetical protein
MAASSLSFHGFRSTADTPKRRTSCNRAGVSSSLVATTTGGVAVQRSLARGTEKLGAVHIRHREIAKSPTA